MKKKTRGHVGRLVGARIRLRRRMKGLTCMDVGKRVYGDRGIAANKVAARNISQLETQARAMSVISLWRVANALDADWRDLLPDMPVAETHDEGENGA